MDGRAPGRSMLRQLQTAVNGRYGLSIRRIPGNGPAGPQRWLEGLVGVSPHGLRPMAGMHAVAARLGGLQVGRLHVGSLQLGGPQVIGARVVARLASVRPGGGTTGTSGFHVTLSPSLTDLPGSKALGSLVNGIAAWALMLALAGLLIGAAMWALGSHSQNYQQSYTGKRAVLVSALAALLIGVAPVLINFFFRTGTGIPNPLNP
jgi:hypothetical protein